MASNKMASSDAAESLKAYRMAVESRLAALVPDTGKPSEAAQHSLLLPGKRLRALITMAAAADYGADPFDALDAACAVEMVHTASLIFDDLPAMDDAGLRRGAATPHVLFGDGVAILAGIGLLNGAFGVLAAAHKTSETQCAAMVRALSDAIGWDGLVQGQAMDLASIDQPAELTDVADIHHGKTGVLFVAAADMGAIIAGASVSQRTTMARFGHWLGQAYQAFDDLVDVVASAESAGKPTQADAGKATAVTMAASQAGDDTKDKALSRATAALSAARENTATGEGASMLAYVLDEVEAHFTRLIAPHSDAA